MTQSIHETLDPPKRPNLRIIAIVGEDPQHQDPENIFNKFIEETFPNLKQYLSTCIQEGDRTSNRLDQKIKPSYRIIIKPPNIPNKEIQSKT